MSEGKSKIKDKISDLQIGDYYRGTVKIFRKFQPGPLILSIYDGFGRIDCVIQKVNFKKLRREKNLEKKGKEIDSFGQKLTPDDIEVDMVVNIFGKVEFHREDLEIDIKTIRTATKDFDEIITKRSTPIQENCSIKSERYYSMRIQFYEVAWRIRRAIIEEQPIFIRHHHDTDGVCAGLAVETAIRNVMVRNDIRQKNRIYRRTGPAPFYDRIALLRDVSAFNKYHELYGDKKPLIVIMDSGSNQENIFALKLLNSMGFEVIVIDHHSPGELTDGKSLVCPYLKFHINPYLFGWDSQTCGGMLGYEIARFIDEEFEQPMLPAVAAIGDRSDCEEVDKAIELSGKTRKELGRISMAMDYLAYNYRFHSGEYVYDKLFENEELVDIIATEVEEMFKKSLTIMKHYILTKEINGIIYNEYDFDKFSQMRVYPTAGRALGQIHDYLVEKHKPKVVFTLGFFKDGFIIRASAPILPVPKLMEMMRERFSEANVSGGGHEQAGSIRYIPNFNSRMLKFVKETLANLKKNQ